jgi:predicted transcriptional regulator
MKPPCEIMTNYIMPAVRAYIARRLIEKHEFTQVSAAEKLGLTQSAMSRYLTSNRGTRTSLSDEVTHILEMIAEDLADQDSQSTMTIEQTCMICLSMRRSGDFCRLHRELDKDIDDYCDVCLRILETELLHY